MVTAAIATTDAAHGHCCSVNAVARCTGYVCSGGGDAAIRVWKARTLEPVRLAGCQIIHDVRIQLRCLPICIQLQCLPIDSLQCAERRHLHVQRAAGPPRRCADDVCAGQPAAQWRPRQHRQVRQRAEQKLLLRTHTWQMHAHLLPSTAAECSPRCSTCTITQSTCKVESTSSKAPWKAGLCAPRCRVWDMEALVCRRTLTGHKDDVLHITGLRLSDPAAEPRSAIGEREASPPPEPGLGALFATSRCRRYRPAVAPRQQLLDSRHQASTSKWCCCV